MEISNTKFKRFWEAIGWEIPEYCVSCEGSCPQYFLCPEYKGTGKQHFPDLTADQVLALEELILCKLKNFECQYPKNNGCGFIYFIFGVPCNNNFSIFTWGNTRPLALANLVLKLLEAKVLSVDEARKAVFNE